MTWQAGCTFIIAGAVEIFSERSRVDLKICLDANLVCKPFDRHRWQSLHG